MSAIADDDLRAQLDALRAENERLRARETVTDDAVVAGAAQDAAAGAPSCRRCAS